MRVAVPKQDFQKALALLNKATDKKSRLSFQWVKLTAEFDQHLALQGTNGEMYLTLKAPVEVEREGQICVEADVLLKAVKSIKKRERIELFTEEDRLVVKAGDLTMKLALKPVEDFPEFPEPKFQDGMWAPLLREGIEKVCFAVATEKEDAMNVLKHVYIDGRGDYTNIVASNGHQLAIVKHETYRSGIKLKLYYKSLKLLKDLLENTLRVEVGSENDFVFLSGKLLYIPKNISLAKILENSEEFEKKDITWILVTRDFSDREYPDYDAVIPPHYAYDTTVYFRAEELNSVLKNFRNHNKITIEFVDENSLKIKAQDEEGNEVEVWVKADVYGNKQFSIDFDPRQLKEFTEVVGKGVIEARFKDDDRFPALFKADDNYSYLVMPIIRKKTY